MALPACVARLAPAATTSCSFLENSGYAMITVEPVASTVTATVTCYEPYYTSTYSRTFSSYGTFFTSARGTCSLSLRSDSDTAVATATASPWFGIETEW